MLDDSLKRLAAAAKAKDKEAAVAASLAFTERLDATLYLMAPLRRPEARACGKLVMFGSSSKRGRSSGTEFWKRTKRARQGALDVSGGGPNEKARSGRNPGFRRRAECSLSASLLPFAHQRFPPICDTPFRVLAGSLGSTYVVTSDGAGATLINDPPRAGALSLAHAGWDNDIAKPRAEAAFAGAFSLLTDPVTHNFADFERRLRRLQRRRTSRLGRSAQPACLASPAFDDGLHTPNSVRRHNFWQLCNATAGAAPNSVNKAMSDVSCDVNGA